MSYVDRIIALVQKQYATEPEFCQATLEVLSSIRPVVDSHPEYESLAILERLVEPERILMFRVPWVDDSGKARINRGWRVQFNSAIGPYKGGLRFDESVNTSILKFLAFEQTFKNALTTLSMGGAKGGSDFCPKGKSDREIMAFCQSFITELYRHIGPNTDIPAGDIGVGSREIGYMYGQYKRIVNAWDGTLTGKTLACGGSRGRTEATGYGLIYFVNHVLEDLLHTDMQGKIVHITGAGNVAVYAGKKAASQGALVQTFSNSQGWLYDEKGLDIDLICHLYETHQRLDAYTQIHDSAVFNRDKDGLYKLDCDIFLPCATQNEINLSRAKMLKEAGCVLVGEGANMPCDLEAIEYFKSSHIILAPAKAANAGGVAVSGLEISQNASRMAWSLDKVDSVLQQIMKDIYSQVSRCAAQYSNPQDLVAGANIAGFEKICDAMISEGIV